MRPLIKNYVLKSIWLLVVLLPLYGCGQGAGDRQDGVSTPRPPNSWVSTGEGVLRDEAFSSLSSANYVNGKALWSGTATGVNNLPTVRYYHTAVWTGSEMIVWGGYSGSAYLNTGGRYDPTTDSWLATSTGANVPTARNYHTAVWSGTEMIIWGGYPGWYTNTGGRYNPTTDTWTATSIGANVPIARYSHTAVWSGAEMIVWGGITDSGYTNAGGRYNPSSDSWTTTSTTLSGDPPSARYYHTGVWTGSVMIVWGGVYGSSTYLNTGGRYDPTTDTWLATSTVNAPSGRAYLDTAVWSGTEMILWGGYGGGCCFLNTGGRYNPSTDTWLATSTVNAPTGRRYHTAVWSGAEMIVWGGITNSGGYTNAGGRYNPSSDTWTATSTTNAPTATGEHTAVWSGTEMIVWGGRIGLSPFYINTGGRYNPTTDSWTATSTVNAPSIRAYHTAVWSSTTGEMIVWGGYNSTNTGGRYNPTTDSWTATSIGANVPSGRTLHTAVWTGTQMIIWGGGGSGINTGGRYNPTTDTWTATSIGANVPAGRYRHTAVWSGTEMIVWGGNNGGNGLDTGGRYNPSSDTWTATRSPSVPSVRGNHTAVWTGTEMIVWGGYGGPILNTGARYNPSTDTWLATSTGTNVPAARQLHATVWTGTEMIVWGGNTGAQTNTGGRYNPTTDSWTATSTGANVPGARQSPTAVWSGSVMIVWGGLGPTNTGGRYNPSSDTWLATSIVNAPSARYNHTAVWTGTEMIVWGGQESGSTITNTGGRYNPSTDTWIQLAVPAPTARAFHTAIWTGTKMIVWGGFITGQQAYVSASNTGGTYNPSSDSWGFTPIGTNVPGARYYHTAVWTGAEMIVWGGFGSALTYLNTGGRYNPTTDSWALTSTGANVPTARQYHTAIWAGGAVNRMIVWGGCGNTAYPSTGCLYADTGGRYDPALDTWTATSIAGAPAARGGHTAVWADTTGEMIVWGGWDDATSAYFNTGAKYNPSSDTWTATSTGANAPTARLFHSAVWAGGATNRMIVWGGYDGGSVSLNTGAVYDPSTNSWTNATSTLNAPAGRETHPAVWTGTEMVVWGGWAWDLWSGAYLDTGGKYDPSSDTWIAVTPTNAPLARMRHTAVWTGTEMIVWGGWDGSAYLSSGGRYTP